MLRPPDETPFFAAFDWASVVAWLVLLGRSCAAASAAASATACSALCVWYQLATSIVKPRHAADADDADRGERHDLAALEAEARARCVDHRIHDLIESDRVRSFVPRAAMFSLEGVNVAVAKPATHAARCAATEAGENTRRRAAAAGRGSLTDR